jgi:hypothetical protein
MALLRSYLGQTTDANAGKGTTALAESCTAPRCGIAVTMVRDAMPASETAKNELKERASVSIIVLCTTLNIRHRQNWHIQRLAPSRVFPCETFLGAQQEILN